MQFREERRHALLLDHLQRDAVDAGSTLVATHAFPCLQQNVTPPDPVIQRMETTLLIALGRDVPPALEFSHIVDGVIGSCDHALALHHQLIGIACARRGPPGRGSPVPRQTVLACPPPYPVGVLHSSGSRGCSLLPSPWHDRLGRPSLSGSYVTRLQGSPFDWARQLASLPPAIRSLKGFRHPARTSSSRSSSGICYATHRRLPNSTGQDFGEEHSPRISRTCTT